MGGWGVFTCYGFANDDYGVCSDMVLTALRGFVEAHSFGFVFET